MPEHHVRITYCTRCRWMLRAGWLAQEILSTFEDDLAEIVLIPDATGGVFRVEADKQVLWDRKAEGGFPQPKELKARLRDIIAPGRDLGHIDGSGSTSEEG